MGDPSKLWVLWKKHEGVKRQYVSISNLLFDIYYVFDYVSYHCCIIGSMFVLLS